MRAIPITLALALLIGGVAPLAAQEEEPRLTLRPRVGILRTDHAVGRLAATGTWAFFRPSAIVGFDVIVAGPTPWLSFRATLDHSLAGELEERLAQGPAGCGFHCPREESRIRSLGLNAGFFSAAADLVAHPPTDFPARPYAFGGLAVTSYDFRHDALIGGQLGIGGLAALLEPALHFGAGLEADVASARLFVEVADYYSRGEPGEVRHDIVYGLGLRFDRPLYRR